MKFLLCACAVEVRPRALTDVEAKRKAESSVRTTPKDGLQYERQTLCSTAAGEPLILVHTWLVKYCGNAASTAAPQTTWPASCVRFVSFTLSPQQQNRISEYIPPETAAQNGQLREEISETLDNVRITITSITACGSPAGPLLVF